MIQEKKDMVIAAETGSGKTLTYVLPLLQRWKDTAAEPCALRALILVPSHLLAQQLYDVIAGLDKKVANKTTLLSSSSQGWDSDSTLVIATPRRIVQVSYRLDDEHFDDV